MIRTPTVFLSLACALLAFATGCESASEGHREKSGAPPVGAALSEVLMMSDPFRRTTRLVEVFEGLGPDDVEGVRLAYERAMPFVDPVATILLAEWWTALDPEAAFEATRRWPLNDPKLGFPAVMRAWARTDPVGARLQLESIVSPERRQSAMRALALGWSDSGNERELIQYLENEQEGAGRQRALQVAAAAMVASRGIDQAMDFARSIPEQSAGGLKLQFARRIATAITQVDPERGVEWALEHAGGEGGDSILLHVASTWIRTEPEKTMAWLRQQPAGTSRDAAMREAYRKWLMNARADALAWLRETGGPPELEPAMELFASATGFEDPIRGLEWAERIESLDLRERAVVAIGRTWLAKDPDAALAWLESADLPASWRERIEAEGKSRRLPPRAR